MIYEYECEKCKEKFEEYVKKQDDKVKCPKCGKEVKKKLISKFSFRI
jgi:putative FmdB family regulatory protein